jgi:hypothetical protein
MMSPECNSGIKDQGARWQLCLMERTSGKIFRVYILVELEIGKGMVGSSPVPWNVNGRTLLRG